MQRFGATCGNLNQPVLLEIRARTIPERLPAFTLFDESMPVAFILQTRHGHIAETLEHSLDKFPRLFLYHRRHTRRIGRGRHEYMILRSDHQRFARSVKRELMPSAHLEINRDPTIEIVEPLNFAKTPRHTENPRSGSE